MAYGNFKLMAQNQDNGKWFPVDIPPHQFNHIINGIITLHGTGRIPLNLGTEYVLEKIQQIEEAIFEEIDNDR